MSFGPQYRARWTSVEVPAVFVVFTKMKLREKLIMAIVISEVLFLIFNRVAYSKEQSEPVTPPWRGL